MTLFDTDISCQHMWDPKLAHTGFSDRNPSNPGVNSLVRSMKSFLPKILLATIGGALVFILALVIANGLAHRFLPAAPFNRLPDWLVFFSCFIAAFFAIFVYHAFNLGTRAMAGFLFLMTIVLAAMTLGNALYSHGDISLRDAIEFLCSAGAAFLGGVTAIFRLRSRPLK